MCLENLALIRIYFFRVAELLGAEGEVAAEGLLVEGDFEGVVVAFAAEEGQDIVVAGVAADLQQEAIGVENDRKELVLIAGGEGIRKCGGSGVGAPVDGVDGKAVALTEDGNGTRVVAHGIVADHYAKVGAVLRGAQVGRGIQVVIGDFPANDIGGYQLLLRFGREVFEYFNYGHTALAEAAQDEGAAVVVVAEVVVEGVNDVAHGQRAAGRDKAVGGEGLERALAVIGGVEVEVAREKGVDSFHLAQKGLADAVTVGVGEMAVKAVEFVIANFGRDDVEEVDRSLAVDDMPLAGVSIVRDGRGSLKGGADCVVLLTGGKK